MNRSNHISENQIEDALVLNIDYLQQLISSPTKLTLIARQLRLNKGKERIDLLLLNAKELILLELKITPFYNKHISQILTYNSALKELQARGELIEKPIKNILLVTKISDKDQDLAKKQKVQVIQYEPINVLTNYFVNISGKSNFMTITPNDYGVMSLYLIIPTLKLYANHHSISKIAIQQGLSTNSINNHLRIAKEFGLLKVLQNKYLITDIGYDFLEATDEEKVGALSAKQTEILKNVVAQNPYFSSSVYGIYSILESTFILSRNSYPVEITDLRNVFKIYSGKNNKWNSDRTIQTITYTFINYASDLGLIAKFGKQIVITPSGFTFILMMQMHKSINMIETLK